MTAKSTISLVTGQMAVPSHDGVQFVFRAGCPGCARG
jgi:hypothetical protein